MGEVGKSLQQDLARDFEVILLWIELVKFQYCKVGFKMVNIFLRLVLHVILESWQFIWVISEKYNYSQQNTTIYEPRGKESTEVLKTENKGKESENSYQKLKRSP